MEDILKYEKELEQLISSDKQNWTKFYLVMREIEAKELYKTVGLKSFTQWVKEFSLKNKIHESVIWNRKKAGKVYESYVEVQKTKGIEVAPIREANIGVDSLVLVDKISKRDSVLGAELTEKAINKEITRDDLRTAYKAVRGDLRVNKEKDSTVYKKDDNRDVDVSETVTAAKIVNALNDSTWLGQKCKKKYFRGAYELDKYKSLTEFPVYTGTSAKSRRIDVLVAENITKDNHYSLNLHAIEIKVSKSDLIGDLKYTEYSEFANFLSVAIPQELIQVAEDMVPTIIGIIVYKDNKLVIHRKATELEPLKIKESLTTLSLRLI